MSGTLVWENVQDDGEGPDFGYHYTPHSSRAKVPGGWLYRCMWREDETMRLSFAITFVPDIVFVHDLIAMFVEKKPYSEPAKPKRRAASTGDLCPSCGKRCFEFKNKLACKRKSR